MEDLLSAISQQYMDDAEIIADSDGEPNLDADENHNLSIRKDNIVPCPHNYNSYYKKWWTTEELTILVQYFEQYCQENEVRKFTHQHDNALYRMIKTAHPRWRLEDHSIQLYYVLREMAKRLMGPKTLKSTMELNIIQIHSSIKRFTAVFLSHKRPGVIGKCTNRRGMQWTSTHRVRWTDEDTITLVKEFHEFTNGQPHVPGSFDITHAATLYHTIRLKYPTWRPTGNPHSVFSKLCHMTRVVADRGPGVVSIRNFIQTHSAMERFDWIPGADNLSTTELTRAATMGATPRKRRYQEITPAPDDLLPPAKRLGTVGFPIPISIEGSVSVDPVHLKSLCVPSTLPIPVPAAIPSSCDRIRTAVTLSPFLTPSEDPASLRCLEMSVSEEKNKDIYLSLLNLLLQSQNMSSKMATYGYQRSLPLDGSRVYVDNILRVFQDNIKATTQMAHELRLILMPTHKE
jgi:hypothetical protein